MKPKSKVTRQHAYAGASILALALLAVLIGVTRSGTQRMQRVSRTLRERQTTLATLQTRVMNLGKLEARHQQLTKRLAILEPYVSTGAYVPTLLRQMERLAQDTGNRMVGLKPQPVLQVAVPKQTDEEGRASQPGKPAGEGANKVKSPAERYERLPIEMSVESNYAALLTFLDRLSTFPKMIAVSEMSLTPAAQSVRETQRSAYTFSGKLDIVALIQRQESKPWKSGAKS
jgi:Tfp pilus assembly protein PilO